MPDLRFDLSELRFGAGLEVKADAKGTIEGLASTFGGVDSYGDRVAPGAFSKSLAAHQQAGTSPVMLWSHDMARIVGRWDRFEERSDGLHASGRLNLQTAGGRDAWEHLKAGDLTGLSIGFRIPKGGARWDEQARVREVREIDLLEVSLVAIPANPDARVRQVRSIGSTQELRDLLRSAGVANRAAERIALAGYAALEGKDPAELEAELEAAAKAADDAEKLSTIAAELRRLTLRI